MHLINLSDKIRVAQLSFFAQLERKQEKESNAQNYSHLWIYIPGFAFCWRIISATQSRTKTL
jgi:hypothetical protein